MYGDGNNAKLTRDIINTVNQITDGLKDSTGVDLSAVLSGFLALLTFNWLFLSL